LCALSAGLKAERGLASTRALTGVLQGQFRGDQLLRASFNLLLACRRKLANYIVERAHVDKGFLRKSNFAPNAVARVGNDIGCIIRPIGERVSLLRPYVEVHEGYQNSGNQKCYDARQNNLLPCHFNSP
jgi:hypothetical protein